LLRAARLAGAISLILLLATSVPAGAHTATDWYDIVGSANQRFPWDQASDTTYRFSSGSTWPTGWKNAVSAAHGHWNDALGSTLFSDLAQEAQFPGTDCNIQTFGESFIRRGPAQMDALAVTRICFNLSTGVYSRWWITIDTTPTWFPGTGDAPSGQDHLRGIMTHEFGHVTGFGTGSNNTGPDHFAESDQDACPSGAANRATMCPAWGTTYETDQYLMTTLEPHDTHTFTQVY